MYGISLHPAEDYASPASSLSASSARSSKVIAEVYLAHKNRALSGALEVANNDLDVIMEEREEWIKEKDALDEELEKLKDKKIKLLGSYNQLVRMYNKLLVNDAKNKDKIKALKTKASELKTELKHE